MVYALDTNMIIHYLHEHQNVKQNFHAVIKNNHDIVIPRIVDYELFRGFQIQSAPKREKVYFEMTQPPCFCEIVDMGESIWRIAKQIYADLYKKRFTVGELDILIAAFCLHHDYTLVTANTKDFENIEGLQFVNWTEQK